jgi:NADH-quinone oxidoreductase subunit J
MRSILFLILAAAALVSAVLVIALRNPVYSLIALIGLFFSIAAHYVLLNAPFLALVTVIVYAGAIMVLFLFVIMLMNLSTDKEKKKSWLVRFAVFASALLLFSALAFSFGGAPSAESSGSAAAPVAGQTQALGKALFSDWVFPFEVSSVLFLAATVGAVFLGKKR